MPPPSQLAVALALLCCLAAGEIVEISSKRQVGISSSGKRPWHVFTRFNTPVYSSSDTPATGSPGNGLGFVKFRLTFYHGSDLGGRAEVLMFGTGDEPLSDDAASSFFCCTRELVQKHKCDAKQEGQVVLPKVPSARLWRESVLIRNGLLTSQFSGAHSQFLVNDTGYQHLVVSRCEKGTATFDGRLVYMNPYGYLPALLYEYLPFYERMALVYLFVALAWFALNAFHWREVVMLQNCISVVLTMCLVEMSTWYFVYLDFNHSGTRHTLPFVMGNLMSVSRRTVSRMLVIAVCLGWGVVRPSLGEAKKRIGVFGGVYFGFAFALEIKQNYFLHPSSGFWSWLVDLVLTLPVSALDSIIFWWIFISLYSLMAQLHARRQLLKLGLYKKFSFILVCTFLSSLGFAMYLAYLRATGLRAVRWRDTYLYNHAFWQIMYTCVLFAIMLIWRPNANARRYAYAALGNAEDENDLYGGYGYDNTPGLDMSDDEQGELEYMHRSMGSVAAEGPVEMRDLRTARPLPPVKPAPLFAIDDDEGPVEEDLVDPAATDKME